MRRRHFLSALAVPAAFAQTAVPQAPVTPAPRRGRIKQGITRGVFARGMSMEDCCREAARLGIKGFDLDWSCRLATAQEVRPDSVHVSGRAPAAPFPTRSIARRITKAGEIDAAPPSIEAADAGVPNVITFSGNRKGMADREGADNCVAFLNKVKAHAEDKGVTICMEYLNSKVNHKDYMFDHIAWGVDVMKRVNSPRVKILFDIYHAQIMDGDIVRNIRDNFQWIGHFHTGGNPGTARDRRNPGAELSLHRAGHRRSELHRFHFA